MKCENCHKELIYKEFTTKCIYYCYDCFFKTKMLDICQHEFIPMIFILSNNTKRIIEICKKCWRKGNRNFKLKDFNLEKLQTKLNSNYQSYWGKKDREENNLITVFYQELFAKKSEVKQKEYWDEYTEYLNSHEWKEKREIILDRDNNICKICGEKAEQVHHFHYEKDHSEYLFELIAVCEGCHFERYHPEKIKK